MKRIYEEKTMHRTMYSTLVAWKESPYRVPLLLVGARQTGKSWILRYFGEKEFEYCIVVDFEEETQEFCKIRDVIANFGLDANLLLEAVGLDGIVKRSDNTLIILDEIKKCPRMYTALKYICQKRPDAYIAASASWTGLALQEDTTAPIGYVTVKHMFPMTFYEFLEAAREDQVLAFLKNGLLRGEWESYADFSTHLDKRLKQYIAVGGMPKAVLLFLQTGNVEGVRDVQRDILRMYEEDMNTHLKNPEIAERIRYAWDTACHVSGEKNEKTIFFSKNSK